jgi:hypothetical protein
MSLDTECIIQKIIYNQSHKYALYAEYRYAKFRYTEYRCAKYHYADYHYAECHYAVYRNAECRYTGFLYVANI